MELPGDLLLRPPEEAAHRIALGLLEQAAAAAPRLQDPQDAEALHDFRVAIRRLRSTLRAWRAELGGSLAKRHRRALRDVQVATGGGRDAEVGLIWLRQQRKRLQPAQRPGVRLLVDRLAARHAAAMRKARAGVLKAFASVESKVRRRLQVVRMRLDDGGPRRFAASLAGLLRAHAEELRQHLLAVHSVEDREEAHEARIRTKRLRYLLEPLRGHLADARDVVTRCKRLQDVLGDLNDAHVMLEELGRVRGGHEEWAGLQEIARRARRRAQRLVGQLQRDLEKGDLDALTNQVETLAVFCERVGVPPVEIERKYLLSGMPSDMPDARRQEIEQGWLPGEALRERLRRLREGRRVRYIRTIKFGQGLERTELEEQTDARVFKSLWPLTEGCRVHKRRHVIEDGERVWEVDEFLDRELFLAEVELRTVEDEVELPAWLQAVVVREVTEESGFTNLELAR